VQRSCFGNPKTCFSRYSAQEKYLGLQQLEPYSKPFIPSLISLAQQYQSVVWNVLYYVMESIPHVPIRMHVQNVPRIFTLKSRNTWPSVRARYRNHKMDWTFRQSEIPQPQNGLDLSSERNTTTQMDWTFRQSEIPQPQNGLDRSSERDTTTTQMDWTFHQSEIPQHKWTGPSVRARYHNHKMDWTVHQSEIPQPHKWTGPFVRAKYHNTNGLHLSSERDTTTTQMDWTFRQSEIPKPHKWTGPSEEIPSISSQRTSVASCSLCCS
jgi:hypothetical protein